MVSELDRINAALAQVPDPEVPAISVVDLGIIRKVEFLSGVVHVTITPTYSGCPAMQMIEKDVRRALNAAGFEVVEIQTVLSPAWTTDWMSAAAKEKLRAYGIAPPEGNAGLGDRLIRIGAAAGSTSQGSIRCPFCGSRNTKLESQFGPTACKALYACLSCNQPFEYFKPL